MLLLGTAEDYMEAEELNQSVLDVLDQARDNYDSEEAGDDTGCKSLPRLHGLARSQCKF